MGGPIFPARQDTEADRRKKQSLVSLEFAWIDIREDSGDHRSFSEAVQHYFNVRTMVESREQALRLLRESAPESRRQ